MIALLNWVALQTAKDTSGQSIHLTMRTSVGESTNAKGPREETGREKRVVERNWTQLDMFRGAHHKKSVAPITFFQMKQKIEVSTSRRYYQTNGRMSKAVKRTKRCQHFPLCRRDRYLSKKNLKYADFITERMTQQNRLLMNEFLC